MEAVERDGEWQTKFLTTGEPAETYRAKNILEKIATAAWKSGDPGVQFDTVINKWHTCPNSGRINASNPCSEYMHLDNSACNLASINLMRFLKKNGSFDAEAFKQAVLRYERTAPVLADAQGAGSFYGTFIRRSAGRQGCGRNKRGYSRDVQKRYSRLSGLR